MKNIDKALELFNKLSDNKVAIAATPPKDSSAEALDFVAQSEHIKTGIARLIGVVRAELKEKFKDENFDNDPVLIKLVGDHLSIDLATAITSCYHLVKATKRMNKRTNKKQTI